MTIVLNCWPKYVPQPRMGDNDFLTFYILILHQVLYHMTLLTREIRDVRN